ncbi:MAG: phosphopyruvate hydratase [Candidatus Thermoplasmatota archaeon]|nr:phosphopyruvate hydratase [Euryarchaeota archaeon]MBU4032479.1 phosphopyruvate hydratase [Candidatus Thermoplasmatota archaeon]MBU4072133.1 phosphopyruvate hydratase [Candidatus Thermoplasmatota archaeon]MBU4143533.1 phosphopyruvate hydratase [Candidatus Thermoplasmatota archaeon]MBU4591946.1 phosphopyruvate hydratase [Candidatus Thermoplasmatota archaeon]
MTIIENAAARKILDSRGNATVEVEILTESGYGTAAAPSGASTGEHEVMSFPEKGVDASLKVFEDEVLPQLIGMDASEQRFLDALLHQIDGTPNFSRMGGNMAVATSLAVAKAAASAYSMPLYKYVGGALSNSIPKPLANVIGGGRHAIGGTDIQEFLVISQADKVSDCVFGNARTHKIVGQMLKEKLPGHAIGKGDEGAWVAALSNEDALALQVEACDRASSELGFKVLPALDMAASEYFREGKYHYKDKSFTPEEHVDFVAGLVEQFNLHLVEDPMDQNDYQSYVSLTDAVGSRCIIVGDDLFVTNRQRLEKGIEMGAANAVLIKPNQIGTLTDTLETVELAKLNGYKTVISHRSGETSDDTIAHLGVAFGSYAIKTGAVGGERTAKLNELIRIEEDLEA